MRRVGLIDAAAVRVLADRSRIELAPEEVARLAEQLSGILEQMEAITDTAAVVRGGVDEEVEASALRADEPGADVMVGGNARYAPALKDGFFVVPRLVLGSAEGAGAA